MGRLHLDEALERAEVIAEVQIAGRLHAGEHEFGRTSPLSLAATEGTEGAAYGNAAKERKRPATAGDARLAVAHAEIDHDLGRQPFQRLAQLRRA